MFSFLHTADWHIGKPLRGFGERLAGVLEEARLAVIARMAEIAQRSGAKHILVAGDVFDAEALPPQVVVPALQRMAISETAQWHLLPGNHDPARPGGLWDRIVGAGLPANVRAHVRAGVVEIEPGVSLLTAPLHARGRSSDPTGWMDRAETPTGNLRIGLAHGPVRDFTRAGEPAGVIDFERARKARLDYLALGDWHGTMQVSSAAWYAGTPEPDRFQERQVGQALLVKVAPGREPDITTVETGHFVWAQKRAHLSVAQDLVMLTTEIDKLAPSPDRLLLRLTLEGSVPLRDRAALGVWCETLGTRLRHVEIDDDALLSRGAAEEAATLLADPRLARVAGRLADMAGASIDASARRAADRAMQRLLEIASEEARP